MVGRFTKNKQLVRDVQRDLIERVFNDRLGSLRYFGLSSPEMKDVLDWIDYLGLVVAVERGVKGVEYKDQHRLRLTATRHNIQNRLRLLCGDIDWIIRTGYDSFRNPVPYPFDIITLDYSGGLFYRDEIGTLYRLEGIRRVLRAQAETGTHFILFISTNCHAIDSGEVRNAIENLRTELNRRRWNADEVCDAYLQHSDDAVRLKLYVPLFVGQAASSTGYSATTEPPLIYQGNKRLKMLNFGFILRPDRRTAMQRFPQERLTQLLGTPAVVITRGKMLKTMLGLPKLKDNL